ncbi:hypothetical protein M432DRAFT_640016 [Thermoascus aurantiacus ATCC 26904]
MSGSGLGSIKSSPKVLTSTSTTKFAKVSQQNTDGKVVVLIPHPAADGEDPLNWPLHKKILVFACIGWAAFACQMSPNANQLTFSAALSGWVAGPSLIIPLVAVVGCSAIVFWSLISTFICQIWAAKMTGVDAGVDDYIPSTISRLFCGFFGGMPAILGSGYIIDMFFLHRRGKSFAVSERLSSSPSSTRPWDYVFRWTLGPIGAAIIAVFLFVEDTGYIRDD